MQRSGLQITEYVWKMISNEYNGRGCILRIAIGINALVLLMAGGVRATRVHKDGIYNAQYTGKACWGIYWI